MSCIRNIEGKSEKKHGNQYQKDKISQGVLWFR